MRGRLSYRLHFRRIMLEDTKLKVFKAVLDEGSFTAAARVLGITQPAVSQNIAHIEEEVGGAIFEREGGRISLTERGRVFKIYAERILKDYDDLNDVFSHYEAFSVALEKLR